MTGFAGAQGKTSLGHVTVEIRCVNSRFLDISIKFAEELRPAESAVRALISSHVSRGKLEVRASLKSEAEHGATLDKNAVEALFAMQREVLALDPGAKPLTVSQILMFPGVIAGTQADTEILTKELCAIVEEALKSFTASRLREGAALAAILEGNCAAIEKKVDAIEAKIAQIHEAIKTKLTDRLQEALGETLSANSSLTKEDVSDRIRQEVTMYALKLDVQEEINRLRTHCAEVRRVLAAGGPAGRRLDFLTQEMNRESNTLGSKAASIEMTDTSIALKLCVDQMREQLQNIE